MLFVQDRTSAGEVRMQALTRRERKDYEDGNFP
jgi:hypothetical protein